MTPDPFSQLPSLAEWADGLDTPYSDVPAFDQQQNPEIDTVLRLDGDRRIITPAGRRLYRDYRANPDAYRHLDPLPREGETLRGVISGKYAFFELIPALVEAKGKIADLYIATLSFNKQNPADLLALYDEKWIGNIRLCISYYFHSTSRSEYDSLIPKLKERGQTTLSLRSHMKLLLFKMQSGEHYAAEGSPNLRSSVNLEQFCLSADKDVYDFYANIIDELMSTKTDL